MTHTFEQAVITVEQCVEVERIGNKLHGYSKVLQNVDFVSDKDRGEIVLILGQAIEELADRLLLIDEAITDSEVNFLILAGAESEGHQGAKGIVQ